MIYLIYGNQSPMIAKRIKKIVDDKLGSDVNEFNFIKYDGANDSPFDVVCNANMLALGFDCKVITYSNFVYLGKDTKAKILDEDKECLISYIKNPNPDTDLIITYHGVVDKNNDVVKALFETAQICEIKDPTKDEWFDYVKRYMTEKLKVKIDYDAITELAKRTMNDSASLMNNGEKLALYSNEIHFEEVDMLVSKPLDENVFQIFNLLINDKLNESLKVYNNLVSTNVNISNVISVLASEFRTLFKVKYLINEGLNDGEIAKNIGTFDWKVKNLRRVSNALSSSTIINALDDLYILDKQTKSGSVNYDNRYVLVELFLVKFKIK